MKSYFGKKFVFLQAMKRLLIWGLPLMLLMSCRKQDQYPIIPSLEFKSLEINTASKKFLLIATVTDGDGDIGYKSTFNGDLFDNSNSDYYYNFDLTLQYLDNNVWEEFMIENKANPPDPPFLPFIISYRIPYLTPEGKNKSIKAEIRLEQDLPINFTDTMRIVGFVWDRALHSSNKIETPTFVIDTR
jgi:hypothetical protein